VACLWQIVVVVVGGSIVAGGKPEMLVAGYMVPCMIYSTVLTSATSTVCMVHKVCMINMPCMLDGDCCTS